MKKVSLLSIVLILVVSCQKQNVQTPEEYQAEVKEDIAQLDRLLYEAWEKEDLDSVMFFLDEGIINMFSFGMSMTKEQCRENFADVFDNYSVEDVKYDIVEVTVDQNYAVETMLFQQKWITNDKQDTTLFDMRSMTVFKKQEDGSWKFFRQIGQQ